jgi:hypothetical protein
VLSKGDRKDTLAEEAEVMGDKESLGFLGPS